jgi:hypothetical protein
MVTYKCITCDKTWKHKNDYYKHINKKKACNGAKQGEREIIDSIDNPEIKLFVNYLLEQNTLLKTKYEQLIDKVDNIEKNVNKNETDNSIVTNNKNKKNRMNTMHANNIISNNVINTNNTNNTNNINVNKMTINIVAHGEENISTVDDKYITNALNKGFMSVSTLVSHIHFNDKYPQYKNIYIPNKKEPYAMVYTGTDWELRDRNDSLDNLYNKHSGILVEKFEEFYDKLSPSTRTKFKRFVDKYEDDIVIDNIKKELRLLIYNKRKMITNNQ